MPGSYYRVVAILNHNGHFHFTLTNAYSGNNGRAAILNDEPGAGVVYMAGLNPGQPYAVPGYPIGDSALTGLPWAPATDGLRNITGRVNRNGTATICAITSTVSGSGDQGADPNKLVAITDLLGAAGPTPPASESFTTVRNANNGELLRGVSFTPGTGEATGTSIAQSTMTTIPAGSC